MPTLDVARAPDRELEALERRKRRSRTISVVIARVIVLVGLLMLGYQLDVAFSPDRFTVGLAVWMILMNLADALKLESPKWQIRLLVASVAWVLFMLAAALLYP